MLLSRVPRVWAAAAAATALALGVPSAVLADDAGSADASSASSALTTSTDASSAGLLTPAGEPVAISGLDATLPQALAPSQAGDVQSQTVDPSLQPNGQQLDATGTLVPSSIAQDPAGGFTIGTGDSTLSVSPVATAPTASSANVVNGDAALFTNTATSADTVLRPTADGVESYTQLRDNSAPSSYSWHVTLNGSQQLQRLADGDVAVVDPTAPVTGDNATTDSQPSAAPDASSTAGGGGGSSATDGQAAAPVDTGAPSTTDGAAATVDSGAVTQQLDNGQSQQDAAQSSVQVDQTQVQGQVLAVVQAPWAVDANGNNVPTDLSVSGDTITMTVHKDENAAFPIVADPSFDADDGTNEGNAPGELTIAQMNAIPRSGEAHAAAGPCTLGANDPGIVPRHGRRAVEGSGYQNCIGGPYGVLNQRTQACLYKLHHFGFFHRWKKTRCGQVAPDRRGTFRPVAAVKFCDSGDGTWHTVVFGSYYGSPGPGRHDGAVRSENDVTLTACN